MTTQNLEDSDLDTDTRQPPPEDGNIGTGKVVTVAENQCVVVIVVGHTPVSLPQIDPSANMLSPSEEL